MASEDKDVVCRFCWAKIINEENGLCPACRKEYNSEKPALYKPVLDAEDIKLKCSRKRRDNIRRTKLSAETLKILPDLRVVQPNLLFAVGLPAWVCKDKEVLKGPEYFGRYGKVFKVEINQNQTFGGPQGQPSFSAYITFCRSDDAMRCIRELDQGMLHGRPLRVSLGTTKYCSQFLRGTKCTKHECMYLHELGDPAASFTKEEMQAGKHIEYMNKLLQQYTSSTAATDQIQVVDIDSTALPTLTDASGPENTESHRTVKDAHRSVRVRTRSDKAHPDQSSSTKSSSGPNHAPRHATEVGGNSANIEPKRQRAQNADSVSELSGSGSSIVDKSSVWTNHTSTDYVLGDVDRRTTGKQNVNVLSQSFPNGLSNNAELMDPALKNRIHAKSAEVRRSQIEYSSSVLDQKATTSSPTLLTTTSTNLKSSGSGNNGGHSVPWHPSLPSNDSLNNLLPYGDEPADIDFDPFQESQQGLAELLAAEVNKLVVTDEMPVPRSSYEMNGHMMAHERDQIASNSRLPASGSSGLDHVIADYGSVDSAHLPWMSSDTQCEEYLSQSGHLPPLFSSRLYPPPGFEDNIRPPSNSVSQYPTGQNTSYLDFGLPESPCSPNGAVDFNNRNGNLPYPFQNRLDRNFDPDTQTKLCMNESDPLQCDPGMGLPQCAVENNPLLRPDSHQALASLFTTAFHTASAILSGRTAENTQAPDNDKLSTPSKSTPPIDLSMFLHNLYRHSLLLSSATNPTNTDGATAAGTNRTSDTTYTNAAAALSAASVLLPYIQPRSNSSASTSSDNQNFSNYGLPPGLVKPTSCLFPMGSVSEKGTFGAPSATVNMGSSMPQDNGDSGFSTNWLLEDPAIVSSQLTASGSPNQNQPSTENWRSMSNPAVASVDLFQQLWRSGPTTVPPLFEAQMNSAYAPLHPNQTGPGTTGPNPSRQNSVRDPSLQSTE